MIRYIQSQLSISLAYPISEIFHWEKKQKRCYFEGSKTAISEAFRTLRTNIDFMKTTNEEIGRTIFITSSVAKKGKSFTAVNFHYLLLYPEKSFDPLEWTKSPKTRGLYGQ